MREHGEKIRSLESQNKELLISNEHFAMSERVMKEKQQEMQNKCRREVEELEQKFKLMNKNFEEDRRQLKNDNDIKAFHLKQIADEREAIKK